jgi:hypothetical protein
MASMASEQLRLEAAEYRRFSRAGLENLAAAGFRRAQLLWLFPTPAAE